MLFLFQTTPINTIAFSNLIEHHQFTIDGLNFELELFGTVKKDKSPKRPTLQKFAINDDAQIFLKQKERGERIVHMAQIIIL